MQTYLKIINLFQTANIQIPTLPLISSVALAISLNLSVFQLPHLEGKIHYLIAFLYGLNADWRIVSTQ